MTEPPEQFLTINDEPIYFDEDWDTGIGGGLWSTGTAMAKYFEFHPEDIIDSVDRCFGKATKLDVLELGSGNGFLSMCLLALLKNRLNKLVSTDLNDHLALMQQTLDANQHLDPDKLMKVLEHRWGEFDQVSESNSLEANLQSGNCNFDLIVGSDVAYHADLYDILIKSLLQLSTNRSIILLGVTMRDTTPEFFHKLHANGFKYDRLADRLLPLEFRGTTFGIFCVKKR